MDEKESMVSSTIESPRTVNSGGDHTLPLLDHQQSSQPPPSQLQIVAVNLNADATALTVNGGADPIVPPKKKRGRPRKYDADGNLLRPATQFHSVYSSPSLQQQSHGEGGFSLSFGDSGYAPISATPKRARGKPCGTPNWNLLASLGEILSNTAAGDFTAHVVTVNIGEDIAGKILSFSQKVCKGICVLSANGSISNVALRQLGSAGGILTYEGRFELLTLSGSYTITETCGAKSRTGGLSVSLASPDGRVIGGGVAGLLLAASPVQIVIGSFTPGCYTQPKRKYQKHKSTLCPVTDPTYVPKSTVQTQLEPSELTPTVEKHELYNNNTQNDCWNGMGIAPEQRITTEQRISPDINVALLSDDDVPGVL